jgi:excisionase family DNA binding protein
MTPLTRTQVAARLGVAESTVRRLRERGALRAERDEDGTWLFDEASVEAYGERAAAPSSRPELEAPAARRLPPLAGRIAAWMRTLGDGPAGAAMTLRLLHSKSGECVARERSMSERDELDELTERLAACAEGDAEVRGGRSRYELVASRSDGVEIATLSLAVASREPDAELAAAATLVPLNQQLMGYTERLTRMMLDQAERARSTDRESFEQANWSLREQLKEARERIANLERSAEEVARLREDALNQKAARDLFAMQETNAERRKDAVVNKVLTLLPVVAARFGGSAEARGTAGGRADLLLRTLAQSVKPEQWAQMAQHLSDEQKVVFVDLLEGFLGAQGPAAGEELSASP